MQSANSNDIQLRSSQTIYRQQNQIHTFTETKAQDPNSVIKIGSVNETLRALPHQTSGFYRYLFLCLFNIFRQWHVVYFIVFLSAKMYFLCNFHLEAMVSELVLIVIYLMLEIYLRFKTFSSYVMTQHRLKQNQFQVWSKLQNSWIMTPYEQLKPGQIIKVKSSIENNNVLNPINLLPIYLPSKKNHFQLKTTKLNKFEEIKEIAVFQVFKRIFQQENPTPETMEKLSSIKIYFEYTIQNSNVFQGRLKVDQSEAYYISNKLILPQGVPIINEDFIIGLVLVNLSNINEKSLKRALNAQNQTILKTGKTLIPLAMFFFSIGVLTYVLQFLLMYFLIKLKCYQSHKKKHLNITSQNLSLPSFRNFFYNQVSFLKQNSYFIYVGMFIFLLIHRLRDSHVLKQKSQILIKNHIKSIDQFGQTNTIIMDDYFFIDKSLFEVQEMICNLNTEFFQFNPELIYSIIQKSQLLRQEMYDLWISTSRYFKNMPRRYTKIQSSYKIQIVQQKIFKESLKFSTITLAVQIKQGIDIQSIQSNTLNKFVFRITEKPKFTSIERIKDQRLKINARLLIKKKDLLHIMIEIMQVDVNSFDQDNLAYHLISRTYEPTKFEFLALISHRINSNPYMFPLSLIKNQQIINKQNLVILSNKKWKYIELLLEKNKISTNHLVSLQEKDFQIIKSDIEAQIREFKQINSQDQKQAILAIHCNFVSYLTNPQIVRGLIKLARYSKYIIFYDCSQYEKQVCCMNLFEIFPLHIYLSNYICDLHLIEKSNLSVCQKGESTQPYVTLVVKTYRDLQYLILNEAVESINITVFIIKSFLFKNSLLIVGMIVTQFMVYESNYFELGSEYTGILFLTYNIVTSFPVLVYIFLRPEVWQEPIYKNFDPNKLFKLQYITERKVVKQFVRAIFVAGFISLLNYSFLQQTVVENVFFSLLTSCVVASAYYQLFIDDAREKKVQVFMAILVYIVFYIYIYFLELWNNEGFHLIIIETYLKAQIRNLTSNDTIYFFVSNLVAVPLILGILFYGMSASNAKIQVEQSRSQQTSSQMQSMWQIPAKTNQEFGKQLHFRQF